MFIINHGSLSPSRLSNERDLGDSSTRVSARKMRARICTLALLAGDVAAFAIAGFLAFAINVVPQLSPYRRAIENLALQGVTWHGWASLFVAVSVLSYFGSRGHYTSRVPSWTQMGDAFIASAVALACDVFLTVAIYDRPVQSEALFRWVLLAPALLLMRAAIRHILDAAGIWSLRTLIIAAPDQIQTVRAALTSDSALGYAVIGSLSPRAASALTEHELLAMVERQGAAFIIISVDGASTGSGQAFVNILRQSGLPIALLPIMKGLPVVGFRQHYFLGHDIVMLVNRNNLARPVSRVLKAAFDQVGAAIMLFLLAPLMAALILLIKAEGGPAFYRHRRIGAGGRPFDCLKFRSMVPDADVILQRAIAQDPALAAEWAATQKLRDDPRITPIGRFLRSSSLDELPQLLNVVRGEMSLVGPRPIVEAEVRRYGQDIEFYYATKPGITGLWQISGRNEVSYARRVKLDVWYVRNWTLWHDVTILLKTVPAVFLQRGAH